MYRKVDFDINGDERFRELSPQPPSGQGLFIQLLIGKHTTMLPGIITARPAEVFASLDWPIDARALAAKGSPEPSSEPSWEGYAQGCPHGAAAMAELVGLGMAEVDDRAGLIYLPNGLKRNPPPSPNHLTAWAKEWSRVPRCRLKQQIFDEWRGFFDSYGKVYAEAFAEPYEEGSQEGSPKSGSRKQEAGTELHGSSGARRPSRSGREAIGRAVDAGAKRRAPEVPQEALDVAAYLLAAIRSHNPGHAATDAQVRTWAADIDRAMRIDKRSVDGLHAVIDAAHRNEDDTFWRKNLLSGRKVRKQFDQISIGLKASPKSVKVGSVEAKDIDQYPEVGTEEW